MAGPLGLHLTSTDISQMLLESVKGSEGINFSKSSGSDVNYTWEEKQNETNEVVEEVKDDDVIAREWVWGALQTSYRGQKIPLT